MPLMPTLDLLRPGPIILEFDLDLLCQIPLKIRQFLESLESLSNRVGFFDR